MTVPCQGQGENPEAYQLAELGLNSWCPVLPWTSSQLDGQAQAVLLTQGTPCGTGHPCKAYWTH